MRKNATKLAALALTLAMTVTSVALPSSASAATKTVKLNTTSKTLYATGSSAKKTTTLKVTVNGKKKTATFKSSNTKVATVGKTSGKVTAKKAGKATITATYGGKKVTCKITVKAKFVKVTSVSVSPKTVSLAVGKTKTIKTTVKPSNASIKKVTYASSNKSVATVSSTGKITAKKAGTAKVTVTATDGSKKKATVTVKVTKAPTPTATPSAKPDATPVPTETPAATATSASATAITSFKATGAAKLTAEFSGAVSDAAKVEVTKDGKKVDGTATFAADKKSVVFEAKADFLTAEYVIKVTDGDKVLTEKTKVEAAKIADIKILGDTALTGIAAGSNNKDNTEAYIYYDVLNQYGESMRESADINWTISSSTNTTEDKSAGKLTIVNTKTTASGTTYDSYTYGTDIYVVGVNVKSGLSVNKSVKIGMAQAIDKVEFMGFIDTKGDKTKFIQELPANFQKDRYVLCYATLDQNGNKMDAERFDKNKITLLADKPLVVNSTFEADKLYTVGGISYASVKIQPGSYVDNGADVKFTMISNKTGQKTEKIYKVGAGAKLKSLTIQAPTDVVADGDKDVELKYTAIDTNGNETKNYETIVRSTNALTLAANPGVLKISESDSGEAVIKWTDDADAKDFSTSSSYDNQSRIVAISTIVAGGESNNMTFNVSDTRRPVAFKQIKLNGDNNNAVVSGNAGKIDLFNSDDVEYLDQYGAKLDKEKAAKFFEQANTSGFNGKNYAIQVKTSGDTTKLGLTEGIYTSANDEVSYTANLADNGALTTYDAAKADVQSKQSAFNAAKDADDKEKAAEEAKTAYTTAKTAYTTAKGDLVATGIDASALANAMTKVRAFVAAAETLVAKATAYNTAAIAAGETGQTDDVAAVSTAITAAKATYDTEEEITVANYNQADTGIKAKVDAIDTKVSALSTLEGYTFDSSATASTLLSKQSDLTTAKTALTEAETALNDVSKRANVVAKYAIVAKNTTGNSQWTAVSKIDTEEYTVVPQAEVRDRLDITFNADKLKVTSGNSDKDNGSTLTADPDTSFGTTVSNNKNFNDKAIGEFTVKGKTSDGLTLSIPKDAYTDGGAASQLSLKSDAKNQVEKINETATKKVTNVDFYDFNTAKNIRKDASLKLVISVYGTTLTKSIAASDADSAAKEVKFTYKKKFATEGVVNPTNTEIATLTKTAKLDETDDLRYVVLDQYNLPMSGATVSQTIADIKESATGFNHLPGSFAPVQNGTATASVDKAEIGDKYKLTVAVDGTNVSGAVNVTVGSDKSANITDDANSDKTFRETYLNMKRDN